MHSAWLRRVLFAWPAFLGCAASSLLTRHSQALPKSASKEDEDGSILSFSSLLRGPPSIINEGDRPENKPAILRKFNDPLFASQWYLHNAHRPGHDINVIPAWNEGLTGKGITVAIVDDGIDGDHPDLRHAVDKEHSQDFNASTPGAAPIDKERDRHGTRCAGQIASKPGNGVCGVGVAWDVRLIGIRILSEYISTAIEAQAVTLLVDAVDIYNCSWGPADDGRALDGPSQPVLQALLYGASHGRHGRGAIYVFAAGNGHARDNCNADGYANAPLAFTVGAIDEGDQFPPYMEECPAMLAVTYSSSSTHRISTTDVDGQCTDRHGGTSAAAPIASGILALVLQARPDLTWRDVQHLTVQSARRLNEDDRSWHRNGAGLWFSNRFGFGKMDAGRMVEMARSWEPVGPPLAISTQSKQVGRQVANLLVSTIRVRRRAVKPMKAVERAAISVLIRAGYRGGLSLWLRSPSGTTSVLLARRPLDASDKGFAGWTMTTSAFWGEQHLSGDWTLGVAYNGGGAAELVEWRLTLFGEGVPGSRQNWTDTYMHAIFPPSPSHFSAAVDEASSSQSMFASIPFLGRKRRRAWADERHAESYNDESGDWADPSRYGSADGVGRGAYKARQRADRAATAKSMKGADLPLGSANTQGSRGDLLLYTHALLLFLFITIRSKPWIVRRLTTLLEKTHVSVSAMPV